MNTVQVLNIYDYFMEQEVPDGMKAPQKVGWVGKHDQDVRFMTLLQIGVKSGDSILDWGCGLGHLIDYLGANNFKNMNYHGIDINSNTIELAKKCFPEHKFELTTISNVEGSFDWVLASGVFSFGVDVDDVIRDVEEAYKRAKKGVAFNCLLPLEDFVESGFSVYEPQNLLQILDDVYPNVYLIQGYTNDDFTIYITKEPMYENDK